MKKELFCVCNVTVILAVDINSSTLTHNTINGTFMPVAMPNVNSIDLVVVENEAINIHTDNASKLAVVYLT